MKKIISLLLIICAFFMVLTSALPTANAAGVEGYAIFKDEAFGSSFSWHSGLMNKANPTIYEPVIHLKSASSAISDGGASYVQYDTCEGFLKGKGISRYYYTSKDNPSTSDLVSVRNKARDLRLNANGTQKAYSYHFFKQIEYNVVSGQTWVYPADITGFRCDGVVEYSYEYYAHKIYGGNTYWDISRMGTNYKNEHKTTIFNMFHPKIVAEDYMKKGHIIADVDGNGTVNAVDSQLALRYSAGLESLTDLQIARADVDFDGSITAVDARTILRIASGLE